MPSSTTWRICASVVPYARPTVVAKRMRSRVPNPSILSVRELAVRQRHRRAIERADLRGAHPDALHVAREVLDLHEVADAERLVHGERSSRTDSRPSSARRRRARCRRCRGRRRRWSPGSRARPATASTPLPASDQHAREVGVDLEQRAGRRAVGRPTAVPRAPAPRRPPSAPAPQKIETVASAPSTRSARPVGRRQQREEREQHRGRDGHARQQRSGGLGRDRAGGRPTRRRAHA